MGLRGRDYINADTTAVLIGLSIVMKAKIENLEKNELIEMIKTLWVEKILKDLDYEYPDECVEKQISIESLFIDTAINIDNNILKYFGHDV
jgi:hypothetical protein